jgi:outer membrane protein TolC
MKRRQEATRRRLAGACMAMLGCLAVTSGCITPQIADRVAAPIEGGGLPSPAITALLSAAQLESESPAQSEAENDQAGEYPEIVESLHADENPIREAPAELPLGDVPSEAEPISDVVARPRPRTVAIGGVRQVQHIEDAKEPETIAPGPLNLQPPQPPPDEPRPLESKSTAVPPIDCYPIDLPTALRLAGANNLQIAMAVERVREAQARMNAASALWIPSFNAGLIYNKHDGKIQDTRGDVVDVSRNALFVGGGPVIGMSPLNGASNGPARLFVDLSLADVLFEPLAVRQVVAAADANQVATFNDTLLEVSYAYVALVRAQAQTAIAEEAVKNAETLARITADFSRAGAGLEADAQRARAELGGRRRALAATREDVGVASAELARLVRLDPSVTLLPAEDQPVPVSLVGEHEPLRALIEMAMTSRPELDRNEALVEETWLRLKAEQLRPWIPNLYAGVSAGGFGGGRGSFMGNFGDRSDFDAAAIWQLQNLGFGNAARQRRQGSLHRQAHLAAEQIRDIIAADVARAYHRVQARRQQIDAAGPQVTAAAKALQLNFDGIRGAELRPIEAQQAIGALATARGQYIDAVLDYNRAQLELLRALGQPPMDPKHLGAAPKEIR